VFVVIIFFGSCTSKEEHHLTIATAANVQFAMEEIIQAFELETNIDCEMVVSSSGKLTAQIQRGAPFDVFISANMKYPKVLFEKGFGMEQPEIYCHGKLVLWTMKEMEKLSVENLNNGEVKHIAIANPKTAPYGEAAMDVLNHFNFFEARLPKGQGIKNKLVYPSS